jgi:hypothetical protein
MLPLSCHPFFPSLALCLPLHEQAFRAQWFNRFNPGGPNNVATLENYYATCSYGKTLMSDVRRALTCPL